jgi:hypothetical protein
MNQQDSAVSNTRTNTGEDDRKAEANRRAAESFRAVAEVSRESAEARRERAERERIAAEDSRQVAEVDRRAAEEQRRCMEELRQAAKQNRAAAEELRAAAEEAKSVLEEDKQERQNGRDEMSFHLQLEQMPGYLIARFTGAGVPEEVWRQYELIAEHCERTKNDKLLIDTSKAEAEISIVERFLMGEGTQIYMFHGVKIAWVDNTERKGPLGFGGLVARNRWVDVRVFIDLQAAEEWLLK